MKISDMRQAMERLIDALDALYSAAAPLSWYKHPPQPGHGDGIQLTDEEMDLLRSGAGEIERGMGKLDLARQLVNARLLQTELADKLEAIHLARSSQAQ